MVWTMSLQAVQRTHGIRLQRVRSITQWRNTISMRHLKKCSYFRNESSTSSNERHYNRREFEQQNPEFFLKASVQLQSEHNPKMVTSVDPIVHNSEKSVSVSIMQKDTSDWKALEIPDNVDHSASMNRLLFDKTSDRHNIRTFVNIA